MQLDTRRFRPHQVLGDAQHYEAVLEEEQQRLQAQQRAGDDQTNAPAQSDDPWSCIDPDSVPKDVWEAAQLLGEKGLRLLQIYRELADQRWVMHASWYDAAAAHTVGGGLRQREDRAATANVSLVS